MFRWSVLLLAIFTSVSCSYAALKCSMGSLLADNKSVAVECNNGAIKGLISENEKVGSVRLECGKKKYSLAVSHIGNLRNSSFLKNLTKSSVRCSATFTVSPETLISDIKGRPLSGCRYVGKTHMVSSKKGSKCAPTCLAETECVKNGVAVTRKAYCRAASDADSYFCPTPSICLQDKTLSCEAPQHYNNVHEGQQSGGSRATSI